MGLKGIGGDVDIGFGGGNAVVDDERGGHFPQAHEEEVEEADRGSGDSCLQPEVEEVDDEEEKDHGNNACRCEENEFEGSSCNN